MDIETAPGVMLRVVDEGHGDPVVLLHGHTLDLTVFDDVVPGLLGAGFRAIRYDQRGHGGSSSPPRGYRWGDHAADLRVLLEKLGLPAAHLVGLSKGGGIALEAAIRFPAAVRSLVLIGPLVPDFPLPSEFWAFFKGFGRAIRERGVAQAVADLWLPHPLLRSAWENPRCRQKLEDIVRRFPAGEYLAVERDEPDRSWKLLDRLGEIRVPVLVVRGEHEVGEFCQMASFLAAAIPNARLVVIPASGHVVPLEQPSALGSRLLAFYERLGCPGPSLHPALAAPDETAGRVEPRDPLRRSPVARVRNPKL